MQVDAVGNPAYASITWRAPDGVALYARDYGGADGQARLPVVCLHGLTRNSQDFEDIAAEIAATGRRVIVPDVRGRGRSGYDPDPMRYVPMVYAGDILGLLRALGIERAVFMGTSMGGVITTLLAARHRRLVAAAILNDIGPEAGPEGLARIAGYAGKPVDIATWQDAVAYVRAINEAAFPDADDAFWERFAQHTFEREDGVPRLNYDPRIREPIAAGKLKPSPRIGWLLFRYLAWRRPLLVLRGELSDILTRDIARRMQRIAPGMELVEVPRVGHAPMLTEPVARGSIAAFLERVD